MIKKITVMGTGAMGSRMAAKLLGSGFEVAVYNRTRAHAVELINSGARYYTTPVAAVSGADLVISMLTDDNAARTVWLDSETGAIEGMREDAIAVESSTLSINFIKELQTKFSEKKINFLDAPVIGSRPQADASVLIFLVGGDKEVLNKIKPVLNRLSSTIYHMGKNGQGAAIKLAVNGFFATQVSAISELLGWLKKSEMNPTKSIELFSQLPVTSPALKGVLNLMLEDQHQPLFPVKLVEKDLRYLLTATTHEKLNMPTLNATRLNFCEALNKGLADNNISALKKLFI